jgi:hypothetical protein
MPDVQPLANGKRTAQTKAAIRAFLLERAFSRQQDPLPSTEGVVDGGFAMIEFQSIRLTELRGSAFAVRPGKELAMRPTPATWRSRSSRAGRPATDTRGKTRQQLTAALQGHRQPGKKNARKISPRLGLGAPGYLVDRGQMVADGGPAGSVAFADPHVARGRAHGEARRLCVKVQTVPIDKIEGFRLR